MERLSQSVYRKPFDELLVRSKRTPNSLVNYFKVDINSRDCKMLMMSAILIRRLFSSNLFCHLDGKGVFQRSDAM